MAYIKAKRTLLETWYKSLQVYKNFDSWGWRYAFKLRNSWRYAFKSLTERPVQSGWMYVGQRWYPLS